MSFNKALLLSGMMATTANGCTTGVSSCPNPKSAAEYNEGVLTVAADPACPKTINNRRQNTRLQVMAQLGAGAEGMQKDGSWVLCADMSQILMDEPAKEDIERVSSRFQSILLDQAQYLMVSEKCGKFLNVKQETKCITPSCNDAKIINPTIEHVKYAEGEAKNVGTFKFRHDDRYVCLWTTAPAEIVCK